MVSKFSIGNKYSIFLVFFSSFSSNQFSTKISRTSISDLVERIVSDYAYILIDSPAGIDDGFLAAIEPAEQALIVVTPEVPSIRDADKVIGILVAQDIKKISLLVNRIRPKMVKTDDMMSIDDVKNILGVPLAGVIPDSEQVIIASNRGEPLVLEEKLSLPGLAFENTARRLLGEEVDFLNLDTPTSRNPVKRLFNNFINKSKTD